KGDDFPTSHGIPKFNAVVMTPARNALAIRPEGQSPHFPMMASECQQHSTAGTIPALHGRVYLPPALHFPVTPTGEAARRELVVLQREGFSFMAYVASDSVGDDSSCAPPFWRAASLLDRGSCEDIIRVEIVRFHVHLFQSPPSFL